MTRNFTIVTDSCSDLSKEIRENHGIEYVRMGIVKNVGKENEEELPASLDWDLYSQKELFDWLRNGMLMKTTQVSMQEFERVFTKILDEGNDILYIACSSALSGSYNLSLLVKDELLEKHPDAKIICIDTLCSCMGQGSMVLDCANMKNEGKSIDEVAAYLEENKLCYQQFCTVETLDYLKKAGRVTATSAFFGNLFGVKPIIISDSKGTNNAIKKVKGRKNSFNEIVAMAKANIVDAANQTVYVVHADCIEDAEVLKQKVIEEINPKEVVINCLGPIIGVSTGPGTVAIYCKCNKVEI